MRAILEHVYVFIASPGDVPEARSRVRRAIDRVNVLVAKPEGVLFEGIGWEDVRPGRAARAQEVINPYVDHAHIFVGILHQRFGTPTGVAESGTEEEFNRITERWEREDPKPAVWVWFKKATSELLANPDEQLQRVLRFRERIQETTFYEEFADENVFGDHVEEALAQWIHRRATAREMTAPLPPPSLVRDSDLGVLLSLLGVVRPPGEPAAPTPAADEQQPALERLSAAGIVTIDEDVRVSRDLQTFLLLSSRFLSSPRGVLFLASNYYFGLVRDHLSGIVRDRYHIVLSDQAITELTILVRISPKAARLVLFGDTTQYDTLFAHVGNNQNLRAERWQLAWERLAEATLLAVAQDIQHGNISTHLNGQLFAVTVLGLKIAAAFQDGLAFSFEHKFPLAVLATVNMQAGQMAFGPLEMAASSAVSFCHLGEYALALSYFDKVLAGDLSNEFRAATLNNRGLARLHLNDRVGALSDFEAALQLNPELQPTRQNLEALAGER